MMLSSQVWWYLASGSPSVCPSALFAMKLWLWASRCNKDSPGVMAVTNQSQCFQLRSCLSSLQFWLYRRKESLMIIMKTAAALVLLATIAYAQPAPKENPTWFIPSGPKPAGQDDQSFCTAELELSTEQYQTRTSEILLPEQLEPAVCIIFPFAPNTLRYGAGNSLI